MASESVALSILNGFFIASFPVVPFLEQMLHAARRSCTLCTVFTVR